MHGNMTIRPDAFIPPSNLRLSVTRHIELPEDELWKLGQCIADQRPATLYGRADISCRDVTNQALTIIPTVQPKNHANIIGWPKEKSAQKMIAMEIAAAAIYVPNPGCSPQ